VIYNGFQDWGFVKQKWIDKGSNFIEVCKQIREMLKSNAVTDCIAIGDEADSEELVIGTLKTEL